MARDDPQTNLRIPADLKQRLMDAARDSNRTFGAEVVKRLQDSFELQRLMPQGLEMYEAELRDQSQRLERVNAKLDELSQFLLAGPPKSTSKKK